MATINFEERLKAHAGEFAAVVPFEKGDKFLHLDFTENNIELTEEILLNTNLFIQYINKKLSDVNARYGIGGYDELRKIYSRSKVFDAPLQLNASSNSSKEGETNAQPLLKQDAKDITASLQSEVSAMDNPHSGGRGPESRRLHLGTDIWGKPYTKVMAPLNGIVHSFAFNNAFGDYGATIILTHNLDGESFHTLYGHLSLNSIKNMHEGDAVKKGDVIAEFGIPFENGQWPPHLHFQIIKDMQGMKGDYPGVCAYSEREKYLANCPDADLILGMIGYAITS